MLKMQGKQFFVKKNAERVTAILALKAGKIDGMFTFVYKYGGWGECSAKCPCFGTFWWGGGAAEAYGGGM